MPEPKITKAMRERAREHIIENYDIRKLLPRHLEWVTSAST